VFACCCGEPLDLFEGGVELGLELVAFGLEAGAPCLEGGVARGLAVAVGPAGLNSRLSSQGQPPQTMVISGASDRNVPGLELEPLNLPLQLPSWARDIDKPPTWPKPD
jgi:hypothetical protein